MNTPKHEKTGDLLEHLLTQNRERFSPAEGSRVDFPQVLVYIAFSKLWYIVVWSLYKAFCGRPINDFDRITIR